MTDKNKKTIFTVLDGGALEKSNTASTQEPPADKAENGGEKRASVKNKKQAPSPKRSGDDTSMRGFSAEEQKKIEKSTDTEDILSSIFASEDENMPLFSALATATRLMGTIGLICTFIGEDREINLCFRLEAEEYGIEEFNTVITENDAELTEVILEMFGSLGGSFVQLDQRETQMLLTYYRDITLNNDYDLPDNPEEYSFLFLDDEAAKNMDLTPVFMELSEKITSNYQLIHYFMMRTCGMDEDAQKLLTANKKPLPFLSLDEPATLFRDEVRYIKKSTYRSKALILCAHPLRDEMRFNEVTTEFTVENRHITGAAVINTLPISAWEASMILRREEYMARFTFEGDIDVFEQALLHFFKTMHVEAHDVGVHMLLLFPDNRHVKEKIYRIDADTVSSILLLDSGELLVASGSVHNLEATANLMLDVMKDVCRKRGWHSPKQQDNLLFHEEILAHFLDSGFNKFSDFLKQFTM